MKFKESVKKFFSNWRLGVATGGLMYAVSYLLKWTGIPSVSYQGKFIGVTASVVDIDLRNQMVTQGGLNTLGTKIIDTLSGVASKLPFTLPAVDPMEVLAILIGGVALVGTGTVLVNWLGADKAFKWADKWIAQKVLAILTLGFIATYIITGLIAAQWGFFTVAAAILALPALIYYTVTALLLTLLSKMKGFDRWVTKE